MSNIYEALQNADSNPRQMEKSNIAQVAGADIPSINLNVVMEQEMISLYRQIDVLLPDTSSKVLQFIGSQSGDGVSTIVREYAFMVVKRLGKSVLMLDSNHKERDQQHFFRITNTHGWDELASEPEATEKAITRIGDSNLYVSGLSRCSDEIALLDTYQLKRVFEDLKTRFDLVLIDSSSLASNIDNTILSPIADGVLLVVVADKTRLPVVENLKKKTRNSGGNILGMVFNKRCYYIPEFLYKRL